MKAVEIDFIIEFEDRNYATLHRIAKSSGLTVEKYLINQFDDLIESWELGGVKNEIYS
jgi:hypothetical protein